MKIEAAAGQTIGAVDQTGEDDTAPQGQRFVGPIAAGDRDKPHTPHSKLPTAVIWSDKWHTQDGPPGGATPHTSHRFGHLEHIFVHIHRTRCSSPRVGV